MNDKHKDEGAVREMRTLPRKNMVLKRQTGVDDEMVVGKSRSLEHSPRLYTEATEAGGENPEVLHENGKVKFKEEKQAGMLDKTSMGNMDKTRGHEDSNMGIRWESATSEDKVDVRGRENLSTKGAAELEAQLKWAEDNIGPWQ